MNIGEAVEILCNLADIALIAVFCRGLPGKTGGKPVKAACIALLAALQLAGYALGLGDYLNGRMLLRIFSAVFYIMAFKDCPLRAAAYIAVLLSVCVTACHNLFMAPYLRDFRLGAFALLPDPAANAALCRLIVLAFDFGVIWLAGGSMALSRARREPGLRAAIGVSLLAVELYVKYMLKLHADSGEHSTDIMLFSIIVSVLAIALIIVYEQLISVREARLRQERIETARRLSYESAVNAAQADMNIRRLHHDMKNHVTALLSLCGDDAQLRRYLMSMSSGLEEYDTVFDTGSAVLNGLLSEKLHMARASDVRLIACVDFTGGSFIEDIDVCAIFGNIVDNALCAAARLDNPDDRVVRLKGGAIGGAIVIKCSNPCAGELRWKNGLPVTDRGRGHGIGLLSVRQAVERYGGVLDVALSGGEFTVTMMIPEENKKADV